MALDDEVGVDGADKLRGDVVEANTIWVVRVKYDGSVLLLEAGEAGLAVLALLQGSAENNVGAIGEGHCLNVFVVVGNQGTADADAEKRNRCQSNLPWVIVPPRVPLG
jgi:hypothetical protein